MSDALNQIIDDLLGEWSDDKPAGYSTREKMRELVEAIPDVAEQYRGWGDYASTVPTQAVPLTLVPDVATPLPNDALRYKRMDDSPVDVDEFWDVASQRIIGREGDGLSIGVEFKAVPPVNNADIEIWIDIGGSVPPLYRGFERFPRGSGQERSIYWKADVYQLDTWAANGGQVMVRGSHAIDIYDVRFVFHRLSKGYR